MRAAPAGVLWRRPGPNARSSGLPPPMRHGRAAVRAPSDGF